MLRTVLVVGLALLAVGCDPAADDAAPASVSPEWTQISALDWPEPQGSFETEGTAETAMRGDAYAFGNVELYCRLPITAEAIETNRIGENRLSLEHVYPAELIARHFGYASRDCAQPTGTDPDETHCRAAIADLRNLWPALERMNQSRGTAPYGELAGEGTDPEYSDWSEFCADFERQRSPDPAIVEPTDDARGDIARTLLYMHFVYNLPLEVVVTDPELLLVWHQDDPPDVGEIERENAIEELQPNGRNPLL